MKKFISLLLALLLIPAAALASVPDLSAMTTEELTQLRNDVSLELASRSRTDNALASWDTPVAHVELLSIRRGTTKEGKPGVALIFSYTNTGTEVDTFRNNHWVVLYHDGVECGTVIYLDNVLVNNDTWGAKVMPGRTLQAMEWFFELSGTEDTVDVEIEDRTGRSTVSAGIFSIQLPSD